MTGTFLNLSTTKFSLNGLEYHKVFIPVKVSDTNLKIVNVYDTNFVLLESTRYDEVTVDGAGFLTVTDALNSLSNIVYSKLATGGEVDASAIQAALGYTPANDSEVVKKRSIKSISNTSQYTLIAADFTDFILDFTANAGETIQVIINAGIAPLNGQIQCISSGNNFLVPTAGAGVTIVKPEGTLLKTTSKGWFGGVVLSANTISINGNLESSSVSVTDNELKSYEIPEAELSATPTKDNIQALVSEWLAANATDKLDIQTICWEVIEESASSKVVRIKGVAVYDVTSIDLLSANVRNDGADDYLNIWEDQSPNGNFWIQNSEVNQFKIESLTKSLIPDGVDDYMAIGGFDLDSSSGYSAYFCLEKDNSEDLQIILNNSSSTSYNIFTIKNGTDYEFRINDGTNNISFVIGTDPNDLLGKKIFEVHHDNAGNAELLINGVSKATVSGQASILKSFNRLGSRTSGLFLTGKINAIQSYELLDSTERAVVRQDLAVKFGITI